MYPHVTPAGYAFETHADGSPKMFQPSQHPTTPYLATNGTAICAVEPGGHPTAAFNGWRFQLRKLRTLMSFADAAKKHEEGCDILCESKPDFAWTADSANPFYDGGTYGLRAWMFTQADYYVAGE